MVRSLWAGFLRAHCPSQKVTMTLVQLKPCRTKARIRTIRTAWSAGDGKMMNASMATMATNTNSDVRMPRTISTAKSSAAVSVAAASRASRRTVKRRSTQSSATIPAAAAMAWSQRSGALPRMASVAASVSGIRS